MPPEVVARARGDNLRGHVPGITFLVGNQGGRSQEPTGREFTAQRPHGRETVVGVLRSTKARRGVHSPGPMRSYAPARVTVVSFKSLSV